MAKNITLDTATLSVALAVMLTDDFLKTVLPFAGLVIETIGGVLSPETGKLVGAGVGVGVELTL